MSEPSPEALDLGLALSMPEPGHLDCPYDDAVAFLRTMRAANTALIDAALTKAKADVLTEAAAEWAADPDAVGDSPTDYRNDLRDRAARITKETDQ